VLGDRADVDKEKARKNQPDIYISVFLLVEEWFPA
jgi:hypothetical protein